MSHTSNTATEELPLADFCRPKQWPTIPKNQLSSDGFPVYGANGLIGHHSKYNHEFPTLLITCRGATCGTLNICPPKSYVTGNAMALDELDEDRVDLKFLFYALNRRGLRDAITGSAQPQITRQSLQKVKIPLPPLSEQKRIAGILDKADSIRRKRQQAIGLTEQFLRSAFLDMFGDPVTNPKGWPVEELRSLVCDDDKINYGVVQPGSDIPQGVPVVRVGDFRDMAIDMSGLKKIAPAISEKHKRSVLIGDEILVACVGSIGLVAVADANLSGCNIVRAVARIRCGPRLDRLFLASLLSTHRLQSYFTSETRKVAQPTLNIKQIEETQIILPPQEEQRLFANLFNQRLTLVNNIESNGIETENLFNSLVQRAFRGEL